MGVERSDYIMIGANIGYDRYDDEEWDKYEDYRRRTHETGEIAYVLDGMNGNYFAVGIILECDRDGYDGLSFHDIPFIGTSKYDEYKETVRKHIKENFNLDIEPSILVFTHWH